MDSGEVREQDVAHCLYKALHYEFPLKEGGFVSGDDIRNEAYWYIRYAIRDEFSEDFYLTVLIYTDQLVRDSFPLEASNFILSGSLRELWERYSHPIHIIDEVHSS